MGRIGSVLNIKDVIMCLAWCFKNQVTASVIFCSKQGRGSECQGVIGSLSFPMELCFNQERGLCEVIEIVFEDVRSSFLAVRIKLLGKGFHLLLPYDMYCLQATEQKRY